MQERCVYCICLAFKSNFINIYLKIITLYFLIFCRAKSWNLVSVIINYWLWSHSPSCFTAVLFSPAKPWYSTKHRQSSTKPPDFFCYIYTLLFKNSSIFLLYPSGLFDWKLIFSKAIRYFIFFSRRNYSCPSTHRTPGCCKITDKMLHTPVAYTWKW